MRLASLALLLLVFMGSTIAAVPGRVCKPKLLDGVRLGETSPTPDTVIFRRRISVLARRGAGSERMTTKGLLMYSYSPVR